MADFLSPILPSNQLQMIKEEDKKKKFIPLELQQQQTPSSTATSSSSSVRKPRGRPLGSKNKPKPPIIVTQQAHSSSMHQVFLQISPSSDVITSVLDFARRRRVGVSVLSACGPVVNVELRHPAVPGSTIALSGRFEILSLSGFFLPPAEGEEWESCKVAPPFGITVAGAQGQVIGGTVAGGLTAAGMVVVTAVTFVGPEFYKLPLTDEEAQVQREEDVKNKMVLWGSPPHLLRPPASQHY